MFSKLFTSEFGDYFDWVRQSGDKIQYTLEQHIKPDIVEHKNLTISSSDGKKHIELIIFNDVYDRLTMGYTNFKMTYNPSNIKCIILFIGEEIIDTIYPIMDQDIDLLANHVIPCISTKK